MIMLRLQTQERWEVVFMEAVFLQKAWNILAWNGILGSFTIFVVIYSSSYTCSQLFIFMKAISV